MRCWIVGSAVLPPIPLPLSPTIPSPNGSSSSTNRRFPNAEDSCYVTEPPFPSFKWRLVIAYDGTRYAGWQYQRSPPTIQCLIENALTRATKLERKDLRLVGASRTDTGVHAWGQVAHFITPFNYDSLDNVHAALNGLLPADIRVREISPAVPDFHARFSTISKVYHYKIYNGTILDPFQRCYTYHCVYKLNYAAMREAANYFIGKHDFSAFANAAHNDRVVDPVKVIFRFDVIEMGPLVQLEVEGSGFLYRQVRNMVALLIQIGKEAIAPDVVPKILASGDRKELAKYAPCIPPQGLCLMSINYKEDHLKLPSGCPGTSFGRRHSVSKSSSPFLLLDVGVSLSPVSVRLRKRAVQRLRRAREGFFPLSFACQPWLQRGGQMEEDKHIFREGRRRKQWIPFLYFLFFLFFFLISEGYFRKWATIKKDGLD